MHIQYTDVNTIENLDLDHSGVSELLIFDFVPFCLFMIIGMIEKD